MEKQKILIVDDSEMNREILTDILDMILLRPRMGAVQLRFLRSEGKRFR
jgi:PleD family two-component response regulator